MYQILPKIDIALHAKLSEGAQRCQRLCCGAIDPKDAPLDRRQLIGSGDFATGATLRWDVTLLYVVSCHLF